MKYLSNKPSFSQVKNFYVSELEDEIDALATLIKKYRKARTLERFEEVDVLSERHTRHMPPRRSGETVSWDFKQRKTSRIRILEHNKGVAVGLLKPLQRADTPARLKKAIKAIDNKGYAEGIACVTLRSFDWWVQEMGYHPDRHPPG